MYKVLYVKLCLNLPLVIFYINFTLNHFIYIDIYITFTLIQNVHTVQYNIFIKPDIEQLFAVPAAIPVFWDTVFIQSPDLAHSLLP